MTPSNMLCSLFGRCNMKNTSVLYRNSKCYFVVHSFLRRTQPKQCFSVVSKRFFSVSHVKFPKNGTNGKTSNIVKKNTSVPKASELRRLMKAAHPERWKIAGAVCLLVISSSVSLAVPFYMGKIIDIINESAHDGTLMEKLTTICSYLLVVFAVGALANFGRSYLMDVSAMKIIQQIRQKLFSSVMKQDIGFFDKTKTGELISRLSTDSYLVGRSVTFNISDGLRALAQALGATGMMVYTSPKLALIAMGIVPPIVVMSKIYGSYVRKITTQVQDSLAAATSVAEEKVSNIRTVRSFTKEKEEMESYNKALQKVLSLGYKQALASAVFWGSTGFSGNLIVLSVFYAGGYMMSESMLTIGELSAFLLYAAYIGISLSGMTSFYSELNKGLGASTRIWELTDRVPQVPFTGGIVPIKPLQGKIDFREVNFKYPSREESSILSRLNLTMPPGTVTAVVGASGSGKSTLGSLLLRFYDPNSGEIYLDDVNIRDIDPQWLRHQIGVVSQEPALFSCSIADNIRYGATDPSVVTSEMVEDAARQAFADIFIRNFPQQYDTLVGERGLMLSGGQKQRIALARAIIKNPKILLLDEATSALDSESEYYVKEALHRLMVGRTVITIAHRLSTIREADQIAVLDKGAVAELGSYEQLTAMQDGIFRKLVEKQTITY
ncbi:ATP-binding cassette sub-family B member 10, mitochondrial-like isoform X1 [Mya arenaria]|uniref:ATP-binding cassette sub-family B member 10, mitochondrial-like isoform X1 n=2 Tax=Mya arenaria TaxID=6604 RepID=UPI0022E2CF8B|nr:ATP-binding cassette sub-family B member 10, mitochondrial-like isoform X1 [Mya arenaria]